MANKQGVYYIGNLDKINPAFWERLKVFYEKQNFDLIPYDDFDPKKSKLEYLLLLNPYLINKHFYKIHLLWIAYLKQHMNYKETKLIVSGFRESCEVNASNYISFLNYSNFEEFFKNLKSIRKLQAPTEKDLSKINISKTLIDFFKGHHDRSLFQRFNYLEMSLKNINFTIKGEISRTFREAIGQMMPLAKKEWKRFENRWRYYYVFLESTPFKYEGESIENKIKSLNQFFKKVNSNYSENDFEDVLEGIAQIRENLDKMSHYVEYKEENIDD